MLKGKMEGTFYGGTEDWHSTLSPTLNIKTGAASKGAGLGHSKKGLSVAAASTTK